MKRIMTTIIIMILIMFMTSCVSEADLDAMWPETIPNNEDSFKETIDKIMMSTQDCTNGDKGIDEDSNSIEDESVASVESTETVLVNEDKYLPIKIINLDENGEINSWNEYFYDDNGNKLGENFISSNGKKVYFYIYEYDENGFCVYEKYKNDDYSVEDWHVREFDSDGNQTGVKTYSVVNDGTKFLSGETTFDRTGNILCIKEFGSSGEILTWREYFYDIQGRKIAIEDCTGRRKRVAEYIYDDNGQKIRYKGISGFTDYEYDAYGNLISEKRYNKDSSFSGQTEYTYDDRGNQITCTKYDEDGKTERREKCVYDRGNNLIEETVWDSNGQIVERQKYEYQSFEIPIKNDWEKTKEDN